MSIGFIKRLLTIANLTGLAVIALAAWGYLQHKGTMEKPPQIPVFVTKVKAVGPGDVRINAINMQLGRFPKMSESKPAEEAPEAKEEIESVLARLGKITNAIVVYPPYASIWPTLSFELDGSKQVRVLRLGEAIETKPHPTKGELVRVPHRYKFIGCEPDPKNPGWTYFVFDMNCDGKDIQKARWQLEEDQTATLESAEADPDGLREVKTNAVVVAREDDDEPGPTTVEPVGPDVPAPVDPQPTTTAPDAPPEVFFEQRSGTFEPTAEGARWVKENYQSLISDVKGSTWRDPRTNRPAGIQIKRIRAGSRANAFGLRTDDVILAVNDRPVTSKDQAMKVVKAELQKPNNHIIRVKVLRFGEERILRFDSRDPETRRAARDAMR